MGNILHPIDFPTISQEIDTEKKIPTDTMQEEIKKASLITETRQGGEKKKKSNTPALHGENDIKYTHQEKVEIIEKT
ncbi:hypothetical protein PR048_026378 [Dryococelus australis]|uniref:Uncharacterized protein n=1 Tax=Dryococelus australis TaxID=614101 RepID=A0ABQ9GL60_9NEOP|nr:hypothetical protein PR048_026378 [Dryococelus australis]